MKKWLSLLVVMMLHHTLYAGKNIETCACDEKVFKRYSTSEELFEKTKNPWDCMEWYFGKRDTDIENQFLIPEIHDAFHRLRHIREECRQLQSECLLLEKACSVLPTNNTLFVAKDRREILEYRDVVIETDEAIDQLKQNIKRYQKKISLLDFSSVEEDISTIQLPFTSEYYKNLDEYRIRTLDDYSEWYGEWDSKESREYRQKNKLEDFSRKEFMECALEEFNQMLNKELIEDTPIKKPKFFPAFLMIIQDIKDAKKTFTRMKMHRKTYKEDDD